MTERGNAFYKRDTCRQMNASHSGANPFYREHMVLHRCLRKNAQNSCLLWVILFRWLEDASLDKSDWRTFCYMLLRKTTNNKNKKNIHAKLC